MLLGLSQSKVNLFGFPVISLWRFAFSRSRPLVTQFGSTNHTRPTKDCPKSRPSVLASSLSSQTQATQAAVLNGSSDILAENEVIEQIKQRR